MYQLFLLIFLKIIIMNYTEFMNPDEIVNQYLGSYNTRIYNFSQACNL